MCFVKLAYLTEAGLAGDEQCSAKHRSDIDAEIFLENAYTGSYILDSRVRKLVPRAVSMIKNMTLCKEQWSKMS